MAIKQVLKKIPGLLSLKRSIYCSLGWGDIENGSSQVKLLQVFAAYAPNSAGGYDDRAALTISTIQNIFPAIVKLTRVLSEGQSNDVWPLLDPKAFAVNQDCVEPSLKLAGMFNHYSSDKAKVHDYHFIYASLLGSPDQIKRILEIGLGTNNDDVVSTMGTLGKPGASLRAFRDYCPNAMIYGADIDSRILFQDDRIATHYVDQLSSQSLENLRSQLPSEFDLVIDDGLHSPDANINSLAMATGIVRKGGWIVVEDIAEEAIPIWQCIASLLEEKGFRPMLFRACLGIVFAAQRL